MSQRRITGPMASGYCPVTQWLFLASYVAPIPVRIPISVALGIAVLGFGT